MSPRGSPSGAELFQPMLATAGEGIPSGDDWVFEPKYDGIRVVALATSDAVGLVTRNGHDKCKQFPEITRSLRDLARRSKRNLVLDGEIVALDANGDPARFQELQGRMHVIDTAEVEHLSSDNPAALITFDILVDGTDLLLEEPWVERRKRLVRVLKGADAKARVLRVADVAEGSADDMLAQAQRNRWEGLMAKRKDGQYEPGRRVRHWRKIKLENRQEFVVGGFTEPRNSRKHFGALLLGYYNDAGELVYAGHTGGGFSDALLDEIFAKLRSAEQPRSPFVSEPDTNERAHWTKPKYVVEVKFNEWTKGGNLRQPIFVGWRDDKDPRDVRREDRRNDFEAGVKADFEAGVKADFEADVDDAVPRGSAHMAAAKKRAKKTASANSNGPVVDQLRADPKASGVTLQLDKKTKLDVTNLGKIFFPVPKFTKGRLMEFYAEIAPFLLPALEDRPLVLKRWPNGIGKGGEFYQQKAPDKVPAGVRVESVADDGITTQNRLIGGNLATLLYQVQLGAISTDPWHSRVQSIANADYSIVDLDPGPKATFKRVIQVARWVKEELDELGLTAVLKTSGASGIHIVMPLPRGAGYDVSVALAELVARRVAEKYPKETTVQRMVKSRPPAAVYVDYLQNIRGKTVASVYSCRAETHASVSTPLKWTELTNDLDPRDFTIENVPKRIKKVGDLWAAGMRRPNRLPGIAGDAAA